MSILLLLFKYSWSWITFSGLNEASCREHRGRDRNCLLVLYRRMHWKGQFGGISSLNGTLSLDFISFSPKIVFYPGEL